MQEFFELYNAEEPKLRNFARGFFDGRLADADDALQNTLISAHKAYPSIKAELRNFSAWIYRVATNSCLELLRKQRRYILVSEVPESDLLHSDPLYDDLIELVKELPDIHRDVVILRFWSDMKVQDVANALGIPLGTAKSRLNHALKILRDRVDVG